jgi:TIR domain/NACHT domain
MESWRKTYLAAVQAKLAGRDELFVPLTSTVSAATTDEPEDLFEIRGLVQATQPSDGSNGPGQPMDALAAVLQYAAGRIIVLGDPGSGKTTLLERTALELTRRAIAQSALPIPVVVPLRLLARATIELVAAQLTSRGGPGTTADVESLLERGHLILLLDGLNETGDPAAARRELHQFSCRWPRAGMIFSGRRHFDWSELASHKLVLEELSANDVRSIAAKYAPGLNQETLSRFECLHSPMLVRLACTVAMTGPDGGMNTEGDIYRAFTKRHESRRQIPRAELDRFSAQCRPALVALAVHQFRSAVGTEPRVAIDHGEALDVVSTSLRRAQGAERGGAARDLLAHLLDWHLVRRQGNMVEFIHERFLEYFAGEALLELAGRIPLEALTRNYLNKRVWCEPLYFTVNMCTDHELTERLINALGVLDPIAGDRAMRRARVSLSDKARRERIREWHSAGKWTQRYAAALQEADRELNYDLGPGLYQLGMWTKREDLPADEIALYEELENLLFARPYWPCVTAGTARPYRPDECDFVKMPVEEARARRIFISYASEDHDQVAPFVNALRLASLEPWFDRSDIAAGDSIPDRVEHAIDDSLSMLVFHSAHYAAKHWGNEEWRAFLSRKLGGQTERRLFVYRLDLESELPPFLASRLWRTEQSPSEFATEIATIVIGSGV